MKVKRIQWLVVLSVAFAVLVVGLFGIRNWYRVPVRTYSVRNEVHAVQPTEASSGIAPTAQTEASTQPELTYPININTATQSQLEQLPGIGPTLAGRIIDYREANGPFGSAGELINVSGIGTQRLEAIWDLITVGGA